MSVYTCIYSGAFIVALMIIYLNTFVFNEQFLIGEPNKDEFTHTVEHLGEIGGLKYIISDRHGVLSFSNFLDYMVGEDPRFRNFLIKCMSDFPSDAFFWECKPVSQSTLEATSFEFVLIPSTELAGINGSSIDFKDNFDGCETRRVTSFPNIEKDALLVAPCPGIIIQDQDTDTMIDSHAAGHLASFVRHAPNVILHTLFRTTGVGMMQRLQTVDKDNFHGHRKEHKKIWLSTSGLGVPWVHIRIDATPKYYTWEPYANTMFS